MKIKIDFHTHSEGSYDGKEPVDLMLEHVNDIDIDGIAVTDHDEIDQSLEALQLSEEYDNVIAIPGVEVSTKDGHLLAIGVEEQPESHQPYMETIKEIREMGGAAVVPHPFQKTRHGVSKRKVDDCDAVEIYNAWLFTGLQNRRARKFAEENNYSKTAASDAHSIGMIGRAYTEIEVEADSLEDITAEDIVQSVKEGGNKINGRRAPVYRSFYHYVKATFRKTFYYSSKALDQVNDVLREYTIPLKQYRKIKNVRD